MPREGDAQNVMLVMVEIFIRQNQGPIYYADALMVIGIDRRRSHALPDQSAIQNTFAPGDTSACGIR
jgi:hypothetical protein